MAKRQNLPSRKIAGVYVGWRGQSIEIPGFNLFTFWEHKSTTLDVGYLEITELFLKLEEISNARNGWSLVVKSRLILMGHSFGSQGVYGATAQILASRFTNSREHKAVQDYIKGFGDLVVLFNPAFEALRYLPLYDLSNNRCSYFESQRSRLAILTSETDYATKLAFPAGRYMLTLFESYDTIDRTFCSGKHKRGLVLNEGDADRTTIGYFDPLISHELTPVLKAESLSIEAYDNIDNVWGLQVPGATTIYGRAALKHLNRTEPRNPYLNIRVSTELIADHVDIWRDEVQEFIHLLVILAAHDEAARLPVEDISRVPD